MSHYLMIIGDGDGEGDSDTKNGKRWIQKWANHFLQKERTNYQVKLK